MQQPTLAPAPHNMRSGPDHGVDQAIAQQLMSHLPQQQKVDSLPTQSSTGPHDHNIDPAIAGSGMMNTSAGDSGGDDNGATSDGRKNGKRELSTSKRAAQNRAAQRAFRQRKEGHIKQLEAQVKDYQNLHESYKAVQAENYQLRDYIISLQSRLIESQGECPQPPSNIDLPRPGAVPQQQMQAPTAPMGTSAVSQLQASAAQAVADLGNSQQQDDPIFRGSNQPPSRSRADNKSNVGS